MILYSIDPGINGCGLAAFQDGVLIRASYVRPQKGYASDTTARRVFAMASSLHLGMSGMDPTVVIERPQVYREVHLKGDPNDLLPLAEIGGCLMGLLGKPIIQVLPRQWKGTVDPEVMIQRIKERLTPEEFSKVVHPENSCLTCRTQETKLFCTKPHSCVSHNTYDAIGVGLHFLGRLERRRVICR